MGKGKVVVRWFSTEKSMIMSSRNGIRAGPNPILRPMYGMRLLARFITRGRLSNPNAGNLT